MIATTTTRSQPTPNAVAQALTGRPYVTYSELRAFRSCPLKWSYQYVEKAPMEQLSGAMLLGTCVHAAIQRMLEASMAAERPPSIDEMMEAYRQKWKLESAGLPVQYARGQDAATSEALARRMVEAFLASDLARPPGEIIGIEETFRVILSKDLPDLAGRVDLVSLADSVLTVTDFKTARSIPTEDAPEEQADQLLLYSQGCQPMAESLDARIRLRFVYIGKTKEPKVEALEVPADADRITRSKRIIRQVFEAMQTGITYPSPSPMNCTGCPFRRRCERWHEQGK